MARLNVSLTNDVAKRIQEFAEGDGKTISSVISESVDLYFQLRKMGLSKGNMMRVVKFQEILKSLNAVPIPGIVLDLSMNVALENSEKETMKFWCEGGKVIAEIMKTNSPDFNSLIEFVKEYSNLIPVNKVELRNEDGKVEFLLMGSGYTQGASKVTSVSAKCFLEVYGVRDLKETISEGFVKITGSI